MKLAEAYIMISDLAYKPFEQIFSEEQISQIIINKGKAGQLLEVTLGKKLDSANIDFEDGELKTNKCDKHGNPCETIFITQISKVIDDLLNKRRFEETHLYEKINNILYVPVCKDGNPREWMYLPPVHVDLMSNEFSDILETCRKDYYIICEQLKLHIENSGSIHTSNGEYIQVRSKDAKDSNDNYHPIYSNEYGRYISDKNHAFYFKKNFVCAIKSKHQKC